MGTQGRRAHPLHAIVGLALLLALTGLAAACGGSSGDSPAATPSPQATPMTLKVMEFNIEYGGTTVDFDQVVAAVKAASPDVIGLEEAETNTKRLAKAAGYPYWSNATQVDLPIPDPGAGGRQGELRLRAGPPRVRRGAGQRAPAVRRPGPAGDSPRRIRREGRRDGDQGPAALHPDRARGPAAAGEARHAHVPGRRLQCAVVEGLHGRRGRHARLREVRGGLAGEQGGGGSRLHRLVACRVPGPSEEPRADLVGGPAQGGRVEPRPELAAGPDRLHLLDGAGEGDGRPARRRAGRPGSRPSPSTRGRPITAAS